ncbi:hypothetical protein B0H34DRAFT_705330 [Crassisporium funariophilum]|nr:hypothetical protein B0H34DRAFT_705330 [Crassisporium funariophilum]
MNRHFLQRRWRGYTWLPSSSSNLSPLTRSTKDSRMSEKGHHGRTQGLRLPKRYARLIVGVFVCAILWLFFVDFEEKLGRLNTAESPPTNGTLPYPTVQLTPPWSFGPPLPPLYNAYRQYEDSLSREVEGDRSKKYIFFANHAGACGWGNTLQGMIFETLVASEAGRGFVFDDYTWEDRGNPYAKFRGKIIPSLIPQSAFVTGYILGLDSRENGTKSISSRVFNRICPREERVMIDRGAVEAFLQTLPGNKISSLGDSSVTGKMILDSWLAFLESPKMKDVRCVEVKKWTWHVFDIWFFGNVQRMLDVWETLKNSPVLNHFEWSPLIHGAFEKNRNLFLSARYAIVLKAATPQNGIHDIKSAATVGAQQKSAVTMHDDLAANSTTPLPILAIHLRRGDFKEHCFNLAEWNAEYSGFNAFPVFAEHDSFRVPRIVEGSTGDYNDQKAGETPIVPSVREKQNYYLRHCYPDIKLLVTRVREVVHDYENLLRSKEGEPRKPRASLANKRLKKIYVMTNGDRKVLDEMKTALMNDAEDSKNGTGEWEFEWTWEGISTSRDLDLGYEEKPVAQALDVAVARRATLFIGNGFSSLTSNVVMFRLHGGLEPLQTRFL